MTSCLRIVPKFSTFNSLAIVLSSFMLMAWSLAMLSEEAILSRWLPRSPSSLASPSVWVGSTGFDGGERAGSGSVGGTDAWGSSAGISSVGFAFGFRRVLGIKKIIIVVGWNFVPSQHEAVLHC